jgi:hypothetical protein
MSWTRVRVFRSTDTKRNETGAGKHCRNNYLHTEGRPGAWPVEHFVVIVMIITLTITFTTTTTSTAIIIMGTLLIHFMAITRTYTATGGGVVEGVQEVLEVEASVGQVGYATAWMHDTDGQAQMPNAKCQMLSAREVPKWMEDVWSYVGLSLGRVSVCRQR